VLGGFFALSSTIGEATVGGITLSGGCSPFSPDSD
jgi:hypothetical protein